MTGPKLNEAPVRRPDGQRPAATGDGKYGTRAKARYIRVSAYKVRQVLDLIRGYDVVRAREILTFCERDAAEIVGKVLDSAVANAEHNDALPEDELYVSACYADEGPTLKRWRPRARGRATRIRKRTCHVTVIVSRMPERELARLRSTQTAGRRARRTASQAADARRRRLGRRTRRGEATPETEAGAAAEEFTEEAEVPQDEMALPEAEETETVEAESSETVDSVEEAEESEENAAETTSEEPASDEER
jgi:large subunit ribosomal protein L22